MRDLITGLAILLLLALTTALVGPHLVDWDKQRAEINRRMSAALGQQVTVEGPISLSLLPVPTVKLAHLRLADGGVLSGSIARLKASAAIPALMRGEIRLVDAALQGGRLVLTPGARNPLAGAVGGPFQVAITSLQISDSSLTVRAEDGRPLLSAEAISGALEASALDGPFRGVLELTAGGARRTLRFSTGRIAEASLRLRAMSENEQAAMRVEYDGSISWAEPLLQLDGRLSGSGNAEFARAGGPANMLWRAEARMKGDAAQLLADQVEISVGPSDRQTVLAGSAGLRLSGDPGLTLTLAARQIDLDRLLSGEENQRPPTPEALLRQLASGLGGAGPEGERRGLSLPVRAEITAGSLLLGGAVVAAPRVAVTLGPDGLGRGEVSGEFPGRTRLQLAFDGPQGGPASFETRDFPVLLAWLHGVPPRQAVVRAIAVEGALKREPEGFRFTGAAIRADDMRFTGDLAVALGGPRPQVTAVLNADQLDVAKLPDLGDDSGDAVVDLDLTLDARRVRFNGVGAGSIRMDVSRRGPELRIGEFSIRDLGGASLQASGVVTGGAPRLSASLQGERLEAVLELLDRLLPHAILPHLKARARELAPAQLTLQAEPLDGKRWRLALKGRLGGSDIDGALRLEPNGGLAREDGVRLSLAGASLGPLMRKLGLPAVDAPGAGPVKVALAGGGLGGQLTTPWSLTGTVGEAALEIRGDVKADLLETFAGTISFRAADVSPIAQTLLIAVPRVPPGQAMTLSGGLDLRGYRITIREMDARFGQAPVTGEMSFNLAEFGRVAGQLKTPFFDAGVVGPLVFGEPGSGPDGWSPAAFPAAAGVTLPGDLWIEAGEARLMDGVTLSRPSFVLRFDNGLLYLEHAAARFGDLTLKAQGTLRRTGRSVGLNGRIGFAGMLQPGPGSGDGEIEFSSLGESPAQLVAALSGGGALRHRGLELPVLAHTVFDDLAAARERNETLARAALAERLRGQLNERLPVPAGEARLTLGGGVLRTDPLAFSDGVHGVTAGASYDLRNFSLVSRLAFAARTAPKGWDGPPPQAVLTWRGPWRQPQLEVEADELANGLTALAIRRETERIDTLEQDQRERSFFNRRLREADEQRKAEEDRRRLEAERRRLEVLQRQRAEEERRRPEPSAPAASSPPPLNILPPAAR